MNGFDHVKSYAANLGSEHDNVVV